VLHATNLRIPIVEVEGGSLTALAGFDGHQGVALVVAPRRFASLEDILVRAAERGEAPFVLALDSLEDPQNVGTLLRSAEAAGVHGVLFPTRRQAPLTPSAIKASAGAVEHLLLCPVDDLAGALADLHARGLRVAGAEADAPLTARQSDLRGPITIVVGSEGQGLGPAIRRRCDLFMRIPMRGAIGSLNAAVAGSILLFEAVAQRDPNAPAPPPASTADPVPADASEAPQLVAADATPAKTPKSKTPKSKTPKAETTKVQTKAAARTANAATAKATIKASDAPKASTATTAGKTPKATTAEPTKAKTPRTTKASKATKAADAATPTRAARMAATKATSAGPAPKASRARAKTAPEVAAPTASDGDDLLPGGPSVDPATPAPKTTRRRTPRA
jgi:23S rRNA (guanosine2251-2'-O)-methyltransferase